MKNVLALAIMLLCCLPAWGQQELTSGSTDEYVYFVAVDATDLHTRETGLLAAGFTVYYSINGGAATAMTTPTVTLLDDTNMPGEYKLLVDEAGITTLGATKDQANVIFSISHASIDRTTISAVVKRPKITAGQTVTAANGAANADAKYVNAVATTSVTAVNANLGTTQPVNFTSTGASAVVKADTTTWNGTAVASPHTAGYPVVTIKDGTGTGEIDTSSGTLTATVSVTGDLLTWLQKIFNNLL